jgi:cell division protein FtsQ
MSKRQRHGAAVSAPDERGFVSEDESPSPARTTRNRAVRSASAPPLAAGGGGGGAWSLLWSLAKLFAGVVLVVAASGAVAWGAHRYALSTPRFAIKKLELSGNRRLSESEISTLAGLEPGQNIFAFDTANAERKLLENPWLREVKITRELPTTLKVEVTEHEPAALAVIGEDLYLVTRAGEPFKPLSEGDPSDLPVVTGISDDNLARDRVREIERIAAMLEILRHYERVDMSRVHPAQELHLRAGGEAVLTIGGKSPISLHLGTGPWRKKLLMAERVVGRLAARGRLPGIVFLDNTAHPERVVVRMR